MNERIKELYNQCFVVLENQSPNTGFDFEKFAELIVRECAEFADRGTRGGIGELMKEHFGVSE
jgi:hypothetical protein